MRTALLAAALALSVAAAAARQVPPAHASSRTKVALAPASEDGPQDDFDPDYDRQRSTYVPRHQPASAAPGSTLTVTPFFSPDHSADTLTALVEGAAGSVDVGTPSFSSWSGCTPFSGCAGCTVKEALGEEFPLFAALANAVKRGVAVRVLTNGYKQETCAGKVTPLDFLALAGARVAYYNHTTFMHAKYVAADAKDEAKGKSALSSINFSYTSFMRNREAGMLLGDGTAALRAMMASVFDDDFEGGVPYVAPTDISDKDLAIIRSKDKIPVVVPEPKPISGAYVTGNDPVTDAFSEATVYASPDFARDALLKDVASATSTFELSVYQVTDEGLCGALRDAGKRGVAVSVLASKKIVSSYDSKEAKACYDSLKGAPGVALRYAPSYYTYAHRKFWVVDGAVAGLSTGNWSPSDYPEGAEFPPYGQAGWQHVNRDFTTRMGSKKVAAVLQECHKEDWDRGVDMYP